jgi:sigma-E factor negative regulatory protein RseB
MIRLAGLLLGLMLLPLTAGAAAEWQQWAQRMDAAQRSLNYDATVLIDAGDEPELIELSQRIGPSGPEQQAIALNGPQRRWVRTASGLSLLSGDGQRSLAASVASTPGLDADRIASAYIAQLEGRDRVAGRECMRLSLVPRFADRYALRLWLDLATGLPLRSERVAIDGQVLERRLITRLAVHGFAGTRPQPASPAASAPPSPAGVLPAGFRVVDAGLPVPGLAGGLQWILSDGVVWVSIYRLPAGASEPLAPRWQRGALAHEVLQVGAHRFHIYGDAPPATLTQLVEATAQVGEAAAAPTQ